MHMLTVDHFVPLADLCNRSLLCPEPAYRGLVSVIFTMSAPMKFIKPSVPVLRPAPPTGKGWLHEVKMDGYRLQLHKSGEDVALFTRRGALVTNRFEVIARALARIPAKSVVFDGELTALNDHGLPEFTALHLRRSDNLCVWVFDILEHNGSDLRPVPLTGRRAQLAKLIGKSADRIQMLETFEDPRRLLEVCNEQRLEGIVSKRADAPYKSGRTPTWVKVKSETWREENRDRYELFQSIDDQEPRARSSVAQQTVPPRASRGVLLQKR